MTRLRPRQATSVVAFVALLCVVLEGGESRAQGVPDDPVADATLKSRADVSRLCHALTASTAPVGANNAKAASRKTVSASSQAAFEKLYRMSLPARAFTLRYDNDDERLWVDPGPGLGARDSGYLLVVGGLVAPADATKMYPMVLPVGPDEAETIVAAHRKGAVALTVWFHVPRAEQDPPCVPMVRSGIEGTRLAVLPVAYALSQGNERLAEGRVPVPDESDLAAAQKELDDEDGAKQAPAARAAIPGVHLGTPFRTDARGKAPDDVVAALGRLQRGFTACYDSARRKSKAPVYGPLVLGVQLGTGGRPANVTIEIDGVEHAGLVTCVTSALRAAKIPGPTGARYSVPLQFVAP